MKDCCLNCKHFTVWNGDPCCLHTDGWKILLPTEWCNNHTKETFEPILKLRAEMWEDAKKEFFDTYIIENKDMLERYLEQYPEDRSMIKTS